MTSLLLLWHFVTSFPQSGWFQLLWIQFLECSAFESKSRWFKTQDTKDAGKRTALCPWVTVILLPRNLSRKTTRSHHAFMLYIYSSHFLFQKLLPSSFMLLGWLANSSWTFCSWTHKLPILKNSPWPPPPYPILSWKPLPSVPWHCTTLQFVDFLISLCF